MKTSRNFPKVGGILGQIYTLLIVVDGLGIFQYGRTVNYLIFQFYRTAVNRKIRT